MFNNFVALFKGLLSNAFWFGSFAPVAIVVCVHYVFCLWHRGHLNAVISRLGTKETDTWGVFLAIATLVAVAYILSPLVPLFRGILDGTLLPGFVRDLLHKSYVRYAYGVRARISAATHTWLTWSSVSKELETNLWKPRSAGQALGHARNSASITSAERLITPLAATIRSGGLPPIGDARTAAIALETALALNSANLPITHTDHILSARLEAVHRTFSAAIKDAVRESKYRWHVLAKRYEDMNLYDVASQTTRVDDVRSMTESYPLKAYGAEFDFLWPRLQFMLPETGRIQERLIAVQAQHDFAVLSLVLMATVPAVWLPVFAASSSSPWPFLVLAILAPLVLALLYEMVVRTQRAHGEVIKFLVDRFRMDVLTSTLRQPLPATRSAERELWNRASRVAELGELSDFPYRHPSP